MEEIALNYAHENFTYIISLNPCKPYGDRDIGRCPAIY